MVRRDSPPPPFPAGARSLVTHTRGAALSICRLKIDVPQGEEVDITMPAEDAFIALYQLRDHPAHEFRLNGHAEDIGPTPRATLNLVNMVGEPHGRIRQPVDTLFFHVPRVALDEIADDAGAARIDTLIAPQSWSTVDPVIDSLHGLILDALSDGQPSNRLFHDHLLRGIGVHLAAAYGGLRPRVAHRGGLAAWQERRARELIASDLAADLSLDDLARECRLSSAHFARAFKRSTGTTPHGWLQRRRIETAKELLLDRSRPLAEIALVCGFADQSHFTRTFGRSVGVTPGAWRRLQ